MNYNLILHYLHLFFAGIIIFSIIIILNNSTKRLNFYGYELEGLNFIFYIISLFVVTVITLFFSWLNLMAHKRKTKSPSDATDNTL